MTTIAEGSKPVTVINVFTVAPDRQAEVVRLLDEYAARTVRHQPGFVSTNVHASLDGTRVVNYAQWESGEDLMAWLGLPESQANLKAITDIADSDVHLYEVSKVHKK